MLPESVANNGWNPNLWDELEAFARDTVDRHAKLRHLIPRGPDAPGPYPISTPVHDGDAAKGLTRSLDKTEKAVRRWCRFEISPEQIGDADTARVLVERAARILASDEDGALFDWLCSKAEATKQSAKVLVDRIRATLDELETDSFVGPYVFAWRNPEWSRAIDATRDEYARGQRDALIHALGSVHALVRVPGAKAAGDAPPLNPTPNESVVFAQDAFGLDLVFAELPTIAWVGHNDASLQLRLEQRFFLRVHHKTCARRLALPPEG